jgi:hypothetical protein
MKRTAANSAEVCDSANKKRQKRQENPSKEEKWPTAIACPPVPTQDQINALLDEFPKLFINFSSLLTDDQKKVREKFLAVCVPFLFREEEHHQKLTSVLVKLCNRQAESSMLVANGSPNCGMDHGEAMAVSLLLHLSPSVRIVGAFNKQVESIEFKRLVTTYFLQMPQTHAYIRVSNSRTLQISCKLCTKDTSFKVINSFYANKGLMADLIVFPKVYTLGGVTRAEQGKV